MRFLLCVVVLYQSSLNQSTLALDGERDNDPLNVRRVPRKGIDVPPDREQKLRSGLVRLQQKITALRDRKDVETAALLPDILIFERAVRCALDYDEFFAPKDVNKADEVLLEGHRRADLLTDGSADWTTSHGLIVRGYRSRIDHSVQPYGVVIPTTYSADHSVPTRCDLWFHGRGETLSEVNFIWDRMKNAGRYQPENTIVLHPYGRYSNAFKFAGETDVFEALEDVQNRYRVDDDRISVRGFSMGGAACWQFAVHFPDRWFAANPGAGFSETPRFLKYFQKETLHPKPWERALWNLYDCDKYAANLSACPTIAYSGEDDIQKQAADVMATALKEHAIRLRHVIGPKMGHTIDESSRKTIEYTMDRLAKAGRQAPRLQQTFETHTLKYNKSGWIEINELTQHWKPASVSLDTILPDRPDNNIRIYVSTKNVSALTLDMPPGTFVPAAGTAEPATCTVIFDSVLQKSADADLVQASGPFSDGSAFLHAHLADNGRWIAGKKPHHGLRKAHNRQGPIDDAFMDSFVFVRPTGQAMKSTVAGWTKSEMERAVVHWRRHFRGDVRIVDDVDVSQQHIDSANLILWGDPKSNKVMRSVMDDLPVKWDSHSVVIGQSTFEADFHVPVLIYPNPRNPARYVVFNSGFTYRDYAYLNNARQVPMLPDWAVVDLRTKPGFVYPGKIVAADFFDEEWQVKP